jgi:hypothetical protein
MNRQIRFWSKNNGKLKVKFDFRLKIFEVNLKLTTYR